MSRGRNSESGAAHGARRATEAALDSVRRRKGCWSVRRKVTVAVELMHGAMPIGGRIPDEDESVTAVTMDLLDESFGLGHRVCEVWQSWKYTMTAILIHRVLGAESVRFSPKSEVDPQVLIWLYPLIAEGLATGDCVPLMESRWWLRAETVSGRLQASLWLSRRVGESRLPVVPASASPPHVALTVTRPGSPEARPVMEASIAGIASLDDTDLLEQAAAEAGDLERRIAWAWLSHTAQ